MWWMGAAWASPLPPSKPWLCLSAARDREPSGRLFSLVVSFAANRQQQTSSAAKLPRERLTSVVTDKQRQQQRLSGSDVLWALKRATAEKAAKKNKKKGGGRLKDAASASASAAGGNGEEMKAESMELSSRVRPITVKSEWSVILQELENRLAQLIDA